MTHLFDIVTSLTSRVQNLTDLFFDFQHTLDLYVFNFSAGIIFGDFCKSQVELIQNFEQYAI